jgi:DNA-binding NarL/FixJ family response regulator
VEGSEQSCGPVLIADGDAKSRSAAGGLLRSVGLAVIEASNGGEALATARRVNPPLVIMDVDLPHLSGYEVSRQLRAHFGDEIAIMFVSGDRVEPRDRVAGLYLGADDYLVKPFDPGEFLARVNRLLARSNRGIGPPLPQSQLTRRENEVLSLLAQGVPQTAIARDLVISPKTVGNHIQNVLRKLGAHSRAQAVALSYRNGLVSDDTHAPER